MQAFKRDGVRLYKCEHCSFVTKFKMQFWQHLEVHKNGNEQLFLCEHCFYTSMHKSRYIRHLRVHKSENKPMKTQLFNCKYCSFSTKSNQYFVTHLNSYHGAYVTKYKENLRHLNQHNQKVITELKFFKCEHCSYMTRYKGTLTRHTLLHKNPE